MKQYYDHYKENGGEWEYKPTDRKKDKKKTTLYDKKTTPPWKNYQKSIHST